MPVAVIGSHQMLVFLVQLGVVLGAAVLLGRLAAKLRLPALVGELTAGILLGPSLLGWSAPRLSHWLLPPDASQFHLLDAVGQLGVILLVGLSGAHLDLGAIRRHGGTAGLVGVGGLLVPLAAGIGVGYALARPLAGPHASDRAVFALFIGTALCASAIPVIAKTLLEMRILHRDVGQLILAGAALDDMVGWLLLSVVSAMATAGVRGGKVLTDVGWLVALLVLAAAVRPLIRAALRFAARGEEPRTTIAVTATLLILGGATTQSLGFEAILGTFLVGVVIGSCRELEPAKLAPLQATTMGVLAPIFFVTAGLRMDLTAMRRPSVLAAGVLILVVAIVGKFAGAYVGARLGRRSRWEALALGAGLNSRGVVEVIIAMVGLRLGVLNTAAYTVIVLVAVVTSLMAPPMLRVAVARIEASPEEAARREALQAFDLSVAR